MRSQIVIRKAVTGDISVLNKLIDASVRGLQAEDYSSVQIEFALQTVFGVDSQLIADGTYLVAEANITDEVARGSQIAAPEQVNSQLIIVGCGGWSKRTTLYGGDQWTARQDSLLDPKRDAAKIRAFFVHPNWARQGIGAQILQACEDAAKSAGFTQFEMGATLTGVKLFQARGYVAVESLEIPLADKVSLPIVRMAKRV